MSSEHEAHRTIYTPHALLPRRVGIYVVPHDSQNPTEETISTLGEWYSRFCKAKPDYSSKKHDTFISFHALATGEQKLKSLARFSNHHQCLVAPCS